MIQKDVNGTATVKVGLNGWNSNKPSPIGNENFENWAVLNGLGSLTTRYVWGNEVDQQLGRIDAASPSITYWPLQDRLNSIRDVVDNTGALKDSIQYEAFGKISTETTPSLRGDYGYSGRQIDEEIKLQLHHARWYRPDSGRWMSEDPLGFDAGDSNLYRYVMNRPTVATDPSGRILVCPNDPWLAREYATWFGSLGIPTIFAKEPNSGRYVFYADPQKVKDIIGKEKRTEHSTRVLKALADDENEVFY